MWAINNSKPFFTRQWGLIIPSDEWKMYRLEIANFHCSFHNERIFPLESEWIDSRINQIPFNYHEYFFDFRLAIGFKCFHVKRRTKRTLPLDTVWWFQVIVGGTERELEDSTTLEWTKLDFKGRNLRHSSSSVSSISDYLPSVNVGDRFFGTSEA